MSLADSADNRRQTTKTTQLQAIISATSALSTGE